MQIFKTFAEKFQNMIVVTERNISWCFEYYWHAQKQFKSCVFQKGTILSKQKNGLFPESEGLSFLEVTAKTGLWYGLIMYYKSGFA